MRIAREISNRELDVDDFRARARSMINQYPELQGLAWIDERRRLKSAIGTAVLVASQLSTGDETVTRNDTMNGFMMARESQHPGEITLAQDPSLALWLSRRVGIAIRLPDFSTEGFRFTGGRITPGELGPAAFLLYESGAGERVGLFVARIVSDETLAPVYREDRATGTLTWTSGGAGFVLTALGGRERLQALWRLAPGNS